MGLTIKARQASRFPISATAIMTAYIAIVKYLKPGLGDATSDGSDRFVSERFIPRSCDDTNMPRSLSNVSKRALVEFKWKRKLPFENVDD